MSKPKILVFAGSARTQSFNKKLALIAADATYRAGGEITYIDLRDFPLPIYDGDFEAEHGLPREAVELRHLFRQTEGLLIASPEYNHSFSPLLKNTLDGFHARLTVKTIAIFSAVNMQRCLRPRLAVAAACAVYHICGRCYRILVRRSSKNKLLLRSSSRPLPRMVR